LSQIPLIALYLFDGIVQLRRADAFSLALITKPTGPGLKIGVEATENAADVLVIGAGMAGLNAAAKLKRAGRHVLVIDKGRGVGGRMASRRIDGSTFDHGAQFITARNPRFAEIMDQMRRDGTVEKWSCGFTNGDHFQTRWLGRPTMSAVAKHLAHGLDVRLETPVAALRRIGDHWRAEVRSDCAFTAGSVVLTPPVPQSLAILDTCGIALTPEMRTRLSGIEYERCLAVLAVLEGPSRIPSPGGFVPTEGPVAWLADNQLKGISTEPSVTIHANHAFSVAHWDGDRDVSGRALLNASAQWIGTGITKFQVHGWRYSRPIRCDVERCVMVCPSPPLVLAGDGFGEPSVEGAVLSGRAAAESILGERHAATDR
jgi:renalase